MDRAQAHMLEGVVASLLLVSSVVFALQMTAVTPLSASTSNQHIENQQHLTAEGILTTAAETGALERAVLYWNDSNGGFHNASDSGYYTTRTPSNDLGRMLERSFGDRGIAYNVYVVFQENNSANSYRRRRMIYRGEPSDNAVSASHAVTVTDDDRLVFENGTRNDASVSNATTYFANDVGVNNPLYNVVRVEVVVWRV